MKDVSRETRPAFSWPLMPVEAAGVGGRMGRGMTRRVQVVARRLSGMSRDTLTADGEDPFQPGAEEVCDEEEAT
jgi:hypothetical protein